MLLPGNSDALFWFAVFVIEKKVSEVLGKVSALTLDVRQSNPLSPTLGRGCPLRSPYDVANTISQAASAGVGKDSASSGAPAGGRTNHRPGREVRNILERLPANSDNGSRTALGAIRTKLESMAREASPGRLGQGAQGQEGRGGGRAPAGKGDDIRKVAELREAIWGAVGILSGIGR